MSFLLGRLKGSQDFSSIGAERSDSFGCVLYTRCGVLSIFGKWGFYINKIFKKSIALCRADYETVFEAGRGSGLRETWV